MAFESSTPARVANASAVGGSVMYGMCVHMVARTLPVESRAMRPTPMTFWVLSRAASQFILI
jgi:hypothetical protein